MWIFAVFLPLMIGHAIPEDDMWQCFLLLLDILSVDMLDTVARFSRILGSPY